MPRIDLAKKWLHECTSSHKLCGNISKGPLPTRVLDLFPEDLHIGLRLFESSNEVEKYAALSYCWGGAQPLMLTTTTRDSYSQAIDEATLPHAIQDAITITRALSIRYLWVDAYCIIQDSREDKDAEISCIYSIFQNAHITIGASGSPSADAGFLSQESAPICWTIPIRLPNGKIGTMRLSQVPKDDSKLENFKQRQPIDFRAWTLEERLLSSRSLWFTNGHSLLSWRCSTHRKGDLGMIENSKSNQFRGPLVPQIEDILCQGSPHTKDELYALWLKIVEEYSIRTLTRSEDKLRAISGIAKTFSPVLGSRYLAGLWETRMAQDLLWQCRDAVQPAAYRGPSWSWVSLDGPLSFELNRVYLGGDIILDTLDFEILQCEVNLLNDGRPFGAVTDATLTVRGHTREGFVEDGAVYALGSRRPLTAAYMDDPQGSEARVPVTYLAILHSAYHSVDLRIAGLLLQPVKEDASGDARYRRVGVFEEQAVSDGVEWWKRCPSQTFTVI